MLKNYFLLTLRMLQRNYIFSFINITGLSVGMACSILILLWVADEISYDRFHENSDRIFAVYVNQEFSGNVETSNVSSYPLAEALRNKSSQIKHVALTNHGEGYLLTAGQNKVSKMAFTVTPDFFQIFNFKMIKGKASDALAYPSHIVLTQSTAKALFGDQDPLNKFVKIENKHEFKVMGVMEDVPAQSTLQFDFLLPFSFYESTVPWVKGAMSSWDRNSFRLYVELQPDAAISEVNQSIRDLVKDNNEKAPTAEVFLHPMHQWRLYSEFSNGKVSGGMIEYVKMFSVIGIFILGIACINFMNLATARSETRAREVGIRKSVGSNRRQLILQFIGESLLVTCIAFALALVITEMTLPFYNTLVNKNLVIDYTDSRLWVGAFVLVTITGGLAGSYPAFYLSSFKPVQVLKGKVQTGKASSIPRKILVTLQFGFSISLIIGTVVIYQQMLHVKSRHIGYDRENLMLIWTTEEVEKNFQSLRDELERSGAVKSVCKSSAPITRIFSSTDDISWTGKSTDEKVSFTSFGTEYDFTETMGIKMLEGRDFSRDYKSDSTSVIINKTALNLMGLQNPIGQKIRMWENDWTIVGVMEDVIMDSPYRPVDPLVVVFSPTWSSTVSVRLEATNDLAEAITKIENVFKVVDPEHPLWYRFADTEFETKFTSINLVGRIIWIFTLLTILISSLGLFGLAAFMAEQRTKELGIRKVMGASVSSLVMLVSKDFSRLVVFAFVISAPLTWWLLNNFLEQYPYRITLQWWILPLAGCIALLLTLMIVSTQALRAARSNPIDSLRSE